MKILKKGNKKVTNAWAFYDWANSVYPLVITSTIFPVYYEEMTNKNGNDLITVLGRTYKNTALYSYTLSLSFLIIAILSPFLSGIADYSGKKKGFMKFFCYIGAISCAGLYFFDYKHITLGLIFVLLASIGYSGSIVFYNAFLPEISEEKDYDNLSAKGFALGYIGSSILLMFNLFMIMKADFFCIHDNTLPPKISFVTVALWWLGFSQITFSYLPRNIYGRQPKGNIIFKGFKELYNVWNEFKHIKHIKLFLFSFFLYSMGVQTVLLMAPLFGKKEIMMKSDELIITVLIIQFVAIAGAYLFSLLSKIFGNIKALGISIVIWIIICISAKYIYTANSFFVIAGVVGLVMGGIQSLSRSTYSKILPDTYDHASYFSFYDVCEKIGIVIGMFLFGYIEELTGSMRNSSLVLSTFFILALLILSFIPKIKEYAK